MSQKKIKKQDPEKKLFVLDGDALIEDLKRFGYLLPTNDEELEVFNSIFGTTRIMLPQHLKDPCFINNSNSSTGNLKPIIKTDSSDDSKKKVAIAPVKKITANAFFKKLILAAEIATQLHNEYTFGHVKFVKIQFLCDQISNMDLESNYGKFAAGPLDPKLMRTIDSQFKKRKWFSVVLTKYGYKYTPDINAEDYKKYYSRYFGNVQNEINYVINLFRKENSDFCEVVATLFAVWKEHLEKNKPITDEELCTSFYSWSPEKKKFEMKFVIDAISWIKDKNLIPIS